MNSAGLAGGLTIVSPPPPLDAVPHRQVHANRVGHYLSYLIGSWNKGARVKYHQSNTSALKEEDLELIAQNSFVITYLQCTTLLSWHLSEC